MRSSAFLLLSSSLALGSAACAAKPLPPPFPPAPIPKLAPAPPPPSVPPGHLARVEVDRILVTHGASWFFRQVMIDPVMRRDGKFSGWRVVGLPADWSSVDVRPGNVVTRINGLTLERPEEFWEVWASVAKTAEVKIDLMRDGAARQVIIPIDGAPSAETARTLARSRGPTHAENDEAPPGQRSIQLGGPPNDGPEIDAF